MNRCEPRQDSDDQLAWGRLDAWGLLAGSGRSQSGQLPTPDSSRAPEWELPPPPPKLSPVTVAPLISHLQLSNMPSQAWNGHEIYSTPSHQHGPHSPLVRRAHLKVKAAETSEQRVPK